MDPLSIVNKCLGKQSYNPMQMGRVGKDKYSHNMVRYNYFEVVLENGNKEIMYGGSIAAIRRQLEDKNIKYLTIKEMPYGEVMKNTTEEHRNKVRGYSKSVYSNRI